MKHLECALKNENQGWKYFLVFFVGLMLGQMVGAIPLVIVIAIKVAGNGGGFVMPDNKVDFSAYGIDPNIGLFLMVIPFIVSLVIAVLLVKGFHQRSLMQVVNGGGKFRWNRFWRGVIVWGILSLITLVIALLAEPDNFEFRFDPGSFIPLVIISVLFIPFQAGTEEYFFRGYLAQGVAAWTKQRWLVVFVPALFFALLHGLNPEAEEFGFWAVMPSYLLFGIVFGIITILDDGIELAIGTHAVNNVFSSIFVTHKSSVIQTPALFLQKEIDPKSEFWGLLFFSVLYVLILSYRSNWKLKTLGTKVGLQEEPVAEAV